MISNSNIILNECKSLARQSNMQLKIVVKRWHKIRVVLTFAALGFFSELMLRDAFGKRREFLGPSGGLLGLSVGAFVGLCMVMSMDIDIKHAEDVIENHLSEKQKGLLVDCVKIYMDEALQDDVEIPLSTISEILQCPVMIGMKTFFREEMHYFVFFNNPEHTKYLTRSARKY